MLITSPVWMATHTAAATWDSSLGARICATLVEFNLDSMSLTSRSEAVRSAIIRMSSGVGS